MELVQQSVRGGGLADALKQYGVLRSHSITQHAGIQIEEKKLRILEKRFDEEKQKVTLPASVAAAPALGPKPPGAVQSMHLDDRLRSLKELVDEKSEMAGHLSRDIDSGNQMAMYLEMHSMNNRDSPDEFEDMAEREAASRRKIDRTVSTMNKMVQTKEAKSRAALKELLERDGSKLKAYLDRASCLVQMIRELQAAQASGGDTSSIEQELHGALTKRTQGAHRPGRARSQPPVDRTCATKPVDLPPAPASLRSQRRSRCSRRLTRSWSALRCR